MENATKALLIAAGLMIGVILISLFVYMYSNTISMQEAYEKNREADRITKINTSFTVYNGRKDITAQEIVTVFNLAQEYKKTEGITVTVSVNGFGEVKEENKINLIKNNSTEKNTTGENMVIKYTAKVTMGSNGFVNKVEFKKTT